MRFIALASACAVAFTLTACQSSGSTSANKTFAELCEQAKADGGRNTPLGQALIKSHCQPGGFTSETYWKENARQNKCVSDTGKICAQ